MTTDPRQDCVDRGGHCFQRTDLVLTSYPAQYPERCKHCPAVRTGTAREAMEWRYPKDQP